MEDRTRLTAKITQLGSLSKTFDDARAMYDRLDKLERERLDQLDTLNKRIDALLSELRDEEAKRMATDTRILQRLDQLS